MGAALFSMNPPPQVGQGSDSLSGYKLTVRHSTLGVSARIAETARMFDGSGCTHTHKRDRRGSAKYQSLSIGAGDVSLCIEQGHRASIMVCGASLWGHHLGTGPKVLGLPWVTSLPELRCQFQE